MPLWVSQSHQAKHVPKQLPIFLLDAKNVNRASVFSVFVKGLDHTPHHKIYISSFPCEVLHHILLTFIYLMSLICYISSFPRATL